MSKQYYATRFESAQKSKEKIKRCKPKLHVDDSRLVMVQEHDPLTDTIVTRSEYKPIDPVNEMSTYKVSDFSLNTLISIGAPLEPVGALTGSTDGMIKNVDYQLSKMEKYINDNNRD